MVDFGVRLPVAGPLASRDAISRTALAADSLGYSTVWTHDFLVWSRHQDRVHVSCGSIEAVEQGNGEPQFHESVTNLAYLAGLTAGRNIRLGVAVLCVPYRHPVLTARQLANIDVLSDGRLTLGIGVGAPRDTANINFEILGIPREGRYARTEEYVRAMEAIWTEETSTFEGHYVHLPPSEFYPKPVQKPRPPIWVGGFGQKALKMLAAFGDGWLPGLTLRPSNYPAIVEEIYRLADEVGRKDFKPTLGIEITGASIATTSEQARSSAHRTLETVVSGYGGGSHGSVTIEGLLEYTLIGSPEEVIEKVEAYAEAGVEHFELKFVYHSVSHLLEQMELFSREVMPRVQ